MNQTIINNEIYKILANMNQIDSRFLELISNMLHTNIMQFLCLFILGIVCLVLTILVVKNINHIKKLQLKINKMKGDEK